MYNRRVFRSDQDEIDSFMFQSAGHTAIECLAECMDLPLIRRPIMGRAVVQGMQYGAGREKGDEVEDLALLLQDVQVSINICLIGS